MTIHFLVHLWLCIPSTSSSCRALLPSQLKYFPDSDLGEALFSKHGFRPLASSDSVSGLLALGPFSVKVTTHREACAFFVQYPLGPWDASDLGLGPLDTSPMGTALFTLLLPLGCLGEPQTSTPNA